MDFASRRCRIVAAALLCAAVAGGAACTDGAPTPPARPGAAALAVIDGRVLTAAGQPLGNATVRSTGTARPAAGARSGSRWRRCARRTTGGSTSPTSRRAVSPARPRRRIRRRPRAHRRSRRREPDHVGPPGPAETLKGQVVDRSGQPIPGARVLVWSLTDPAEPPRETSTDEAGRFVLGGLTRGLHRLIAAAAGFGSVEQGPIEIPAAAPVMRMETDGHSITGQVTAGGSPAAGARVVIGGENLTPSRETTASGDGNFLISGLGAGAYVLRAARGAEVSRVSSEVVLDRSGDRPPAVGWSWVRAG